MTNIIEETRPLKVFLADIVSKDLKPEILEDRMRELENLVQTYGWVVVLKKIQRKDQPDYRTYIGKWKLEEIIAEMKRLDANVLIIWNIMKPSQIYKVNEQLREIKAEVWDRVDLILKIFDKHAEWMEARMQIELAAIKHMWPRIFNMWMELGRQWWWWEWAMRWSGETNTEIMKRHLKEKMFKIEKKLKEYEQMRKLHRESRIKKGMPTVWIVGYTNTGKSSLLNVLTKKWILAENKLFATLGTHVGNLYLMPKDNIWQGKEILLNDTIWFIRDLPPKLIKSFSSTLEDSIESDLLMHVIDASDPFVEERISVVNKILKEIWANQPIIMVFNKLDLASDEVIENLKKKYNSEDTLRISVKDKKWLEELKDVLAEKVFGK